MGRARRSTGRALTLGLALLGVVALAAGCGSPPTAAAPSSGPGARATAPRGSSPADRSRPPGWAAPVPVDPGQALVAVSCPTPAFCTALAGDGAAVQGGGSSWSAPVPHVAEPSSGPAPGKLACPTSHWCLAIRTGDQVVSWDGSWGAPVVLGGAQGLQAVGCAGTGSCMAIDGIGDGFELRGRAWSPPTNAWGGATDITCPTAAFCVADLGGVSLWRGASWSRPLDVDPSGVVTAVSCPSPSFCAAVDSAGAALQWDGSTWSPPRTVDPAAPSPGATAASRGTPMTDVSCPSPRFCMAVDAGGRALTWNGTTWSAPVTVDPGVALDGVSCPSAASCTATDARGDVVVYRAR